MKQITETQNEHHWPRNRVESILCRPRDLIIRIADWTRDPCEPGYCVEVYIGGVYDWNESKTFTTKNHVPPRTNKQAKAEAIVFASAQIGKLL